MPSLMANRKRSAADGKRDVPDVSLTSAGHDGYLIYRAAAFMLSGHFSLRPSFAGAMALVVQNSGARQGNANTAFYSLATRQRRAERAFFTTSPGNNSIPGQTGFAATTGYDQATGLGSIDGWF